MKFLNTGPKAVAFNRKIRIVSSINQNIEIHEKFLQLMLE